MSSNIHSELSLALATVKTYNVQLSCKFLIG